MENNAKPIDNSYLRYANCWEDADALLRDLNISVGDRVLSIGSGGDNSFSLLVNNPEIVVAVDINDNQLKLIELKKAAFKTLSYPQFLEFLGFKESNKRHHLFGLVSSELSEEGKNYWKNRLSEIETGIIHAGKFEKYFHLFAKKVLPKIHSKKKIDQLLTQKAEKEQLLFFHKKWNTWRWRLLFKVFFSKYVLGKFGRDPKFLEQVSVPVSTFILDKAKNHLCSKKCQSNGFLTYILTGSFGENLPHYARPENFHPIKENLDKLIVFKGFAEDVFDHYSGFNKFNLSNIFEYMPSDLFEQTANNLLANSQKGSRFVYWNLMVDRKMSDSLKEKLTPIPIEENQTDKGFFYKTRILEEL